MKIILAHDHFTENHLNNVVAEMKELGVPTIMVCETNEDDVYQAIEGCHRLRACAILGITPEIKIVNGYEKIEDYPELGYNGCGVLIDDIGNPDNYSIDF